MPTNLLNDAAPCGDENVCVEALDRTGIGFSLLLYFSIELLYFSNKLFNNLKDNIFPLISWSVRKPQSFPCCNANCSLMCSYRLFLRPLEEVISQLFLSPFTPLSKGRLHTFSHNNYSAHYFTRLSSVTSLLCGQFQVGRGCAANWPSSGDRGWVIVFDPVHQATPSRQCVSGFSWEPAGRVAWLLWEGLSSRGLCPRWIRRLRCVCLSLAGLSPRALQPTTFPEVRNHEEPISLVYINAKDARKDGKIANARLTSTRVRIPFLKYSWASIC